MATKEGIRSWFERGVSEGATHMIVVCDTFDYEDYPVYVAVNEDANKRYEELHGKNMQTVMEVYNLRAPMEPQLNERRAKNF